MSRKLELQGQKFNKLTAIKENGKDKKGQVLWLCKCECGNFTNVRGTELKNGKVKSCGCKFFKDLSGQKFGKLLVVKRVENIGKQVAYLCKCDCGNTKVVKADYLRTGDTKSCGCLPHSHVKHGLIHQRIYRIWLAMKNRCGNAKMDSYKNYGKRGIKICEEWLSDFKKFHSWAILSGYNDNLTIERVDNNKGYEPSNCIWIPLPEQSKHRRNVIKIKYNNNFYTIPELAKFLGISYYKLYTKIKKIKQYGVIEYERIKQ